MLSGSSECPRPPEDTELRNIIDKLAQFVARNGQEFEQMTKAKQKDNPKFQFLYGGDHYHYYMYKVAGEQAIMRKQKAQAEQSQLAAQTQMETLKAQILESERNLKAQHDVMLQQQQIDIEEAIAVSEFQKLKFEAVNLALNLGEFEMILNALKDSCSKDAIANCKGWILGHFHSERHGRVMMLYLLRRIKDPESTFTFRLHTLYLINDLLYHCVRKNVEILGRIMADCIPFMYCHAYQHTNADEQRDKLHKLLALWNSNKYLDDSLLDRLRDPLRTAEVLAADMLQQNVHIVNEVSSRVQSQYHQYERQHDEFVRHAETQLANMTAQSQNAQQQLMDMNAPHPSPNFSSQLQQKPTGRRSRFDAGPSQMPMGMPPNQPPTVLNPNVMAPMMAQQPPMGSAPWSSVNPSQQQPLGFPPQMSAVPFQSGPQPSAFPPPGIFNPQMAGPRAPLLTSPPHNLQQPLMNVNVQQKIPEDPTLKPNLAYYDLPAGLMAPLVKLTDCDYEPLNPTAIRLPPPMPPSERLIGAVEAFYSPPNHENPRDADGWEKLGLFEYFKAKEEAMLAKGGRHRVKLIRDEDQTDKENLQENGANVATTLSHSRSSSGSRSNSRSPTDRKQNDSHNPSHSSKRRSHSRTRSSSSSRSKSKSPTSRRRSNSRSPSRSPKSHTHSGRGRSRTRSRSISPFPNLAMESTDGRLDEKNKGHQLLTKMGWSGKGLGAKEHGIEEPVASGEVRDKQDLYKGVGVSVRGDVFEQFRKAKAGQYIQNIRKT